MKIKQKIDHEASGLSQPSAKLKTSWTSNQTFWLIQIVTWTIYVSFDIYLRNADASATFKEVTGTLISYYTGMILTCGLRLIFHRLEAYLTSIPRILLVIIISTPLTSVVWISLDFILSIPLWGFEMLLQEYVTFGTRFWISLLFRTSFITMTWSALYFAIHYTLDWRKQREAVERVGAMADSAQLKMLRYQLNPHFLFNSLSSLRSLIRKNPDQAVVMLTKISDLLRFTLSERTEDRISLGEEMGAILDYYEIEKIRHGENLQIEFEFDSTANKLPIPAFLIHPVAENALKHGFKTSKPPIKIRLSTLYRDSILRIEIINSGRWDPSHVSNVADGSGTGLSNVRKRLTHYYPDKHSLKLDQGDDTVKAVLTIRMD